MRKNRGVRLLRIYQRELASLARRGIHPDEETIQALEAIVMEDGSVEALYPAVAEERKKGRGVAAFASLIGVANRPNVK